MTISAHVRLFVALLAVLCGVTPSLTAGTSPCCPADLTRDEVVDGADLVTLLGDWGLAGSVSTADLDGSGSVGTADLALLLEEWGACPQPCLTTLVVGSVAFGSGAAVSEAVLVTQWGGRGVSGPDGTFRFAVDVLDPTGPLRVTAVASVQGVTYTGTTLVSPIDLGGVTDAGVITVTSSLPCDPDWLPTFGGSLGMNGPVGAVTIFDDGTGPALYAAGDFTIAGGVPANNIAKWSGDSWSPVGAGTNGPIASLLVYDDGNGPALYVGGEFTTAGFLNASGIAKWTGAAWSPLGAGVSGSTGVYILAIFDDGSGDGPALYAGGNFSVIGGVAAKRIAKWNGSAWSAVGSGVSGGVLPFVQALTVFDDGSGNGPALYVGGFFTLAGGVSANNIAKWDGRSWTPIGTGTDAAVYDIEIFDDGSGDGEEVYAAGAFTSAGGVAANRVAKWDGVAWSNLGLGMNDVVYSLCKFDDGSGGPPLLYAGGRFTTAGGVTRNYVAKWNGSLWAGLGAGMNARVFRVVGFDAGPRGTPVLFAVGEFTAAGGLPAKFIGQWNGVAWSAMGTGVSDPVWAMTTFDDGHGPALYVGGEFKSVGGVLVNGIAKWDGVSWSALGPASTPGVSGGSSPFVYALTVYDDGNGPALYAGGGFNLAGGAPLGRLVKWDGTTWSAPGSGITAGFIWALTSVDAGREGGPALYAGGAIGLVGGVQVKNITKWNGTTWSALGTGTNAEVYALAMFDDGGGAGPALYAGGNFNSAGDQPANRIAKWNGSSWSPLGSGLDGSVRALTVFDDGGAAGRSLYVGGAFNVAGGVPAKGIARWNGSSWSALGAGLQSQVRALTSYDDGSGNGPELYAGGFFTLSGATEVSRVAKWNGASWSGLGAGVGTGFDVVVRALAPFDDGLGGGSALFVGGNFLLSPGGDSLLARWGCEPLPSDAP